MYICVHVYMKVHLPMHTTVDLEVNISCLSGCSLSFEMGYLTESGDVTLARVASQ